MSSTHGATEPVEFTARLRLGLCVGVEISESFVAALHPDERAFVSDKGAMRQIEWASGRRALRLALGKVGVQTGPLLADARGAPFVPHGFTASISHTRGMALALVAPASDGTVGIDVERLCPRRTDISARVLTERELQSLPAGPVADRVRDVVTRFSIKEAIYKAIAREERRYVGFHEVELFFEGNCVRAATELPYRLEVELIRRNDLIVATARARGHAPDRPRR